MRALRALPGGRLDAQSSALISGRTLRCETSNVTSPAVAPSARRFDRRWLRTQVVAEQPRPIDASHLARVLRDVEQSTTEHRQRPRFACGEQPGARDLLVALRRQLEPQQVSELTKT